MNDLQPIRQKMIISLDELPQTGKQYITIKGITGCVELIETDIWQALVLVKTCGKSVRWFRWECVESICPY
jgi:hypothetical protein